MSCQYLPPSISRAESDIIEANPDLKRQKYNFDMAASWFDAGL